MCGTKFQNKISKPNNNIPLAGGLGGKDRIKGCSVIKGTFLGI
jgi:hypothetical protein